MATFSRSMVGRAHREPEVINANNYYRFLGLDGPPKYMSTAMGGLRSKERAYHNALNDSKEANTIFNSVKRNRSDTKYYSAKSGTIKAAWQLQEAERERRLATEAYKFAETLASELGIREAANDNVGENEKLDAYARKSKQYTGSEESSERKVEDRIKDLIENRKYRNAENEYRKIINYLLSGDTYSEEEKEELTGRILDKIYQMWEDAARECMRNGDYKTAKSYMQNALDTAREYGDSDVERLAFRFRNINNSHKSEEEPEWSDVESSKTRQQDYGAVLGMVNIMPRRRILFVVEFVLSARRLPMDQERKYKEMIVLILQEIVQKLEKEAEESIKRNEMNKARLYLQNAIAFARECDDSSMMERLELELVSIDEKKAA